MNTSGNTILITGGGSGIGEALAHRWPDLGNHVIVAGRRREALERASAGRSHMSVMTLNVDDPAAVAAFAEEVRTRHPALNVLVANAGIMRSEDLTTRRELTDAEATSTTTFSVRSA